MSEAIGDRDARAAYFGRFYAITGFLSAFVQFFLTSRILELDEFRIRDQHMDILELIEKRKALQSADIGKSSARVKEEKAARNSDQRDKRDRDKERRRVQSQVQRLEEQLAALEQEEKQLQAEVMKSGLPAEALQNGYDRLGQLAERIAAVMEEWERASAQLQELGEAV